MTTSTTKLTYSIRLARLVRFARASLKMRLASLGAGSLFAEVMTKQSHMICESYAPNLVERLGSYYRHVKSSLPPSCSDIYNCMAIPVRCTRGVSHNVGIMLCINKMVDVHGSPPIEPKRESRKTAGNERIPYTAATHPEFNPSDVSFGQDLSQFAGIAIAR